MTVEMTEEQFFELIGRLAVVDATGDTNGKPRLGMAGAEEVFDIFATSLLKFQRSKHDTR